MKMAKTLENYLTLLTPTKFWTPFEFNNVNPRVKHARGRITFKAMATKEFTAYM